MKTFNRTLSTEEGFLQFSFDCVICPGGRKYQVSVLTRGPQPLHFVMEDRGGGWRIGEAPQAPRWIVGMEAELEALIRQQELLENDIDQTV